jgi:cation diffusion facilitator family transporter
MSTHRHSAEPHSHGHEDETKVLDTGHGLVLLSVFEEGVPPRFRVHFTDALRHAQVPPADTSVTLETIRPEGTRQRFHFELQPGDFLEATEFLPEPHEFAAVLTLTQRGGAHSYDLQFLEHDHGHHHDHEHPGGMRGLLEGLLRPHSHDAADSIDDALEGSDEGIKAVRRSLWILGTTAILQLAIVLISGSVGLLADTIHNFADASTTIPLWLAFWVSRRPANQRYTYGYGRAEDLAGVFVVLMIASSAAVAGFESVRRLIFPEQIHNLGWVALAGVIGFIGNEWVAQYRIKVGEQIGSAALVADGFHARTDGLTSLAVLVGTAGVWLGFPQADPLVGLGITAAILLILKDAARQIWYRLMDAVDPSLLQRAEAAARRAEGVQDVSSVQVRWIGHTLHAETLIVADPHLELIEAHQVAERARHEMLHAVPKLSSVTVHVDPASQDGSDPHAELAHHDHSRIASSAR